MYTPKASAVDNTDYADDQGYRWQLLPGTRILLLAD
jgi:hypothetical protein